MPVATPAHELPIPAIDGGGASLAAADAVAVRQLIESEGALLLRGFATTLDGFAGLADRLCSAAVINESPNRKALDRRIQSVNLGADPFPLHPEIAREPWRPDLAMFACIGVPSVGGQTTLCDGRAIVEALPDGLRRELEGRSLIYLQMASSAMLQFWLGSSDPSDELLASPPEQCPYFFRRVPDGIVRGFKRPVFEPTIFQGVPAFANFLLFARDYLKLENIPLLDDGRPFPADWLDTIRSISRGLTYAHRWQQGDVLLADNSRFMHGRRAIGDAEERQVATYFGYLEGVVTRPGDPPDPVWRKGQFVPPDGSPES